MSKSYIEQAGERRKLPAYISRTGPGTMIEVRAGTPEELIQGVSTAIRNERKVGEGKSYVETISPDLSYRSRSG
jgi:hypothetical protein